MDPSVRAFETYGNAAETSQETVPQKLFMADTSTKIRKTIDYKEEDVVHYSFRDLIGAQPNENIDHLWLAFQQLITWIFDGDFVATHAHHMNVNAAIVASVLKAPRFSNATMTEVLFQMQKQKKSPTLKDEYRQIFRFCKDTDHLYRLYFDSAVYWKLAFSNFALPGETLLGLDPEKDARLILALSDHKLDVCKCNFLQLGQGVLWNELSGEFEELPIRPINKNCRCRKAPWVKYKNFLNEAED